VVSQLTNLIEHFQTTSYARRQRLILINGLAEQDESWFRNAPYWRRSFDVHMPNLLVYDGAPLHRRIESRQPISVEYLVEQLHLYLEEFVQTPPYHLVAASLGGKIAVEYAVRYPQRVSRLVLLCPSGMGDEERLPIVEGVRRNDPRSVIESIFHNPGRIEHKLFAYYQRQFANPLWRSGLLRTIRGTKEHCVKEKLSQLVQPTLLVSAANDRIVDPKHAADAAKQLPQGQYVNILRCGHAPQMEKPWLINRLVAQFLSSPNPTAKTDWKRLLLTKPSTIL
jgi:pimeloyl-ACP methyl ester carboxylesterase